MQYSYFDSVSVWSVNVRKLIIGEFFKWDIYFLMEWNFLESEFKNFLAPAAFRDVPYFLGHFDGRELEEE